MSLNGGDASPSKLEALSPESDTRDVLPSQTDEKEKVLVLEGQDFTKGVQVTPLTSEEARRYAQEAEDNERPVDYRYIEQMKTEGVSEELAVKAFVGLFGGNERRTRFFLKSHFYYGSEAPSPLDRLKKALNDGNMSECIRMLEGTRIGLSWGDHF